MPGITGIATTFNLPNYVGDLFAVSPEDTPFLSAIGGLTGGRAAVDKTFSWQYYDLRDAEDDRQRIEGDDAPTAESRTRSEATNVVEIHQEAVEISYTRAATSGRGSYDTTQRGVDPVADELGWQVTQQLKQIARDVNLGFIQGTYANPSNNLTPRKTRGILQAIASNVVDAAGTTPDIDDVLDLFQLAYQNGGWAEEETRTVITTPAIKRYLTKLFIRDVSYSGLMPSRSVGGVNLQTIVSDFGTFNVMIDRAMPAGTLAAVSLEQCAPRFLEVPGKGYFFLEPLAKTGASERAQIYGEIGLEYGNEGAHAKMVDIVTPYDNVGVGSGS